ncbi:MAG: hypothetical protein PHQ32_00250 [Firmicutes bacterium]|nr:hypothetical protein [Bacillota bacterium]
MKLISKLDRIAAWILLASFITYMLSGLDTVKRILIPQLSSLIHLQYLFIPAQIAFAFHTTYAIHLAIKRWNLWNKISKTLLFIYASLNLVVLVYFIIAFY